MRCLGLFPWDTQRRPSCGAPDGWASWSSGVARSRSASSPRSPILRLAPREERRGSPRVAVCSRPTRAGTRLASAVMGSTAIATSSAASQAGYALDERRLCPPVKEPDRRPAVATASPLGFTARPIRSLRATTWSPRRSACRLTGSRHPSHAGGRQEERQQIRASLQACAAVSTRCLWRG